MPVTHSIGIAGLKVIAAPDKIRTVLGSCIGIALFDRIAKVGGLAHVILPNSEQGSGDRGKFADTATDWLLEEIIKAGAVKDRVKAKIAGGAMMFGSNVRSGIGDRNIEAVKARLHKHAIPIAAEAVGGEKGRRMTLDPTTGSVEVQIIGEEPQEI